MPKTILIVLLFFSCFCSAQTPVLPLSAHYGDVPGAYYKDVDNKFDQYTGTWEYVDGTTSLTITLKKETMYHDLYDGNNCYVDLLVGEYKYVENGVEKVNSLPLLNTVDDAYNHNIVGYSMQANNTVLSTFSDPERYILGREVYIILRRVDEGGVEKIAATIMTVSGGTYKVGEEPEYFTYNVPSDTYILVKQ